MWHLDELVIDITGRKLWFWRADDQDEYVLDELIQNRRNINSARRLLPLLKKQGIAPNG